MRITNSMVMNRYTRDLNQSIERLSDDTERTSSNRSFLRASEDPVSAGQAISTATELNKTSQYRSNISGTQEWMKDTETAVQKFTDVLTSASTTLNSASSSGTNSEANNKILANSLTTTYQAQLLSSLNYSYAGQYVFGGSTSGLAPFKAGTDSDYESYTTSVSTYQNTYNTSYKAAISGGLSKTDAAAKASKEALAASQKASDFAPVADITPNGDGTITMKASLTEDDFEGKLLYLTPGTNQYIPVSKISTTAVPSGATASDLSYYSTENSAMTRSLPVDLGYGAQVSSGSMVDGTAFESFTDPLSFLLQPTSQNGTNNVYDDYGYTAQKLEDNDSSSVSNSMTLNTNTSTSTSIANAVVGGKENMLSYLSDKYTSDNTNLTSRLSDEQGLDAATGYMKLSMDSVVYQAALSVSSTILQNNLTNFLK